MALVGHDHRFYESALPQLFVTSLFVFIYNSLNKSKMNGFEKRSNSRRASFVSMRRTVRTLNVCEMKQNPGRQTQMQLRSLMQLRAFHSAKF